MKKLLIVVIGAFALSAGVSSASCILMPTSTNSDNVTTFSLVDSKETGDVIQDVEEVTSYKKGDQPMMISTGSCANTGDVYTDIMANFIAYTDNIHNFFIQHGYKDSLQKYAFLYDMGEELGALVTARVLESAFITESDDMQSIEAKLLSDPWIRKAGGLLTAIGYYHQSLMRQRTSAAHAVPVVEKIEEIYVDDTVSEEEDVVNSDVTLFTGEGDESFMMYSGSYGLTQQLMTHIYSYAEGNQNASIFVTEYVDPGCSHCVTHFQEGAISSLLTTFPTQIQYVMKPVDIGYNASYQSKAIVCAGELGGQDAYIGMYNYILTAATTVEDSLQSVLPTEMKVDEYAMRLHINATQLRECIEDETAENVLDMNRSEAELFNATGTPAAVILNTLTHHWLIVDGKAENQYYVNAVKALMK